ncbi:recombinase family protein [Paenibacillus sp. SI8]|uniref:recombinase family protein n=1 Tax=unclassified Paenibacillus TaxID=185978 RepID=UPI0034679D22
MAYIGYSRVSTMEQSLDLQTDALKQIVCIKIFEEKDSGKNDDRIELAKALEYLREGDSLINCIIVGWCYLLCLHELQVFEQCYLND